MLAAPTLAVLLLLAGVELAVRRTLPHVPPLQLFVTSAHQLEDFLDPRQVSIFEGDPLLFWRLQGGLREVAWDFTQVSTNAAGLRHRRELAPKPEGARRVLCVGDSVTFGYRVPVVFPEKPGVYDRRALPYPMLLEDRFRAEGRDVEVVALAVPGYSSHQGRAWLARDIARLQPDLVTFCFGWNDVSLRAESDAEAMKVDAPRVLARAAVARSQALVHLVRWLRSRGTPVARGLVERVPLGAYVENHLAMVEIARAHGAKAAVIGPVYRDAVTNPPEALRMFRHRQGLQQAVRARGIPYVEVPELMEESYPHNTLLFGEVIHPSAAGHYLMMEALYRLIRREGLLRDAYPIQPPPRQTSPS